MNIYEGKLVSGSIRVGIICARFNEFITSRLLGGALDGLKRRGVSEDGIDVAWVPGAFEIPLIAKKMAASGRYDAVICLGAVIRGSTSHYEYVCAEVSKGIAAVQLETGVPVMFGVLTTENIEQAIERAGSKAGNKGAECGLEYGLFYYPEIPLAPGGRLWHLAVRIAEDAVADAYPVAFHSPLGQQLAALRGLEGFARTVHPAGAQADGMGGVHHIPHHKRSVLHTVAVSSMGKNHDNCRGSVKRVGFRAHNMGVKAAHSGYVAFVLHRYDERRLSPLGGRGVGARLKHGAQFFICYLFRLILPHAAAREQVFKSGIHVRHLQSVSEC